MKKRNMLTVVLCMLLATSFVLSASAGVSAWNYGQANLDKMIKWTSGQISSHAWDGYCLGFVDDAYAQIDHKDFKLTRYGSAKEAANALSPLFKTGEPPVGALVFYDYVKDGINYGHVGISVGNGYVRNALPQYGIVDYYYTSLATYIPGTYLGWTFR